MHPPITAGVKLTLIVLFCSLAGIIFSSNAHAYVQTMTCYPSGQFRCLENETPKPVIWPYRCITYYINQRGSADLPGTSAEEINTELYTAIRASFNAWNTPSCSNITLVDGGLTSNSRVEYVDERGRDGNMNLLIWQDEKWPYASYSAVALTSVTFRSSDGLIVDADIEMNGDMYTFTNMDDEQGTVVDVRNTLTHEVGHFIGFDHSTNPESTMFATAPLGEIKKRVLHQDDVTGLCDVYPTEGQIFDCSVEDGYVDPNEQKQNLNEPDDESSHRGFCSTPSHHTPFNPFSGFFSLLAVFLWMLWRSIPGLTRAGR